MGENPTDEFRVYTVWMPILRKDGRDNADDSRLLLPDRRVTHLWNGDRSTGLWFKKNVTPSYEGKVLWDAYLLYGAEATWEDIPEPLVDWGRTIIGQSQALGRQVKDLLKE